MSFVANLSLALLVVGLTACNQGSEDFSGLEEKSFFETPVTSEKQTSATTSTADANEPPVLSKIKPVETIGGETITFDLSNERTGTDDGMTYSCVFDTVIDGTVAAGKPCDELPGITSAGLNLTASGFSTTTGELTWTTPIGDAAFELALTGANADGKDTAILPMIFRTDKRPKLASVTDSTISVGETYRLTASNTNTGANEPITYRCMYDQNPDGKVSDQATSCRNLPGAPDIKFDASAGMLVWQPSAAEIGHYEMRLVATNDSGMSEITFVLMVVVNQSEVIRLSSVRDIYVAPGDQVMVDVMNELTASDLGVTYSCFVDTLVDGHVAALAACDALPGNPTTKFDPATGRLTWLSPSTANGEYEVLITGSKGGSTHSQVFVISFNGGSFGDVGNAALEFSPASWDFGDVRVNQQSNTKTITITNVSSRAIYMEPLVTSSNHFSLELSSCPEAPVALSGGTSCSVVLRFRPQTAGQLGTLLTAKFGKTATAANEFRASTGLSGTGVGELSFTGLDTINGMTHNRLTLNWTATPQAVSFLLFRIHTGGAVEYLETMLNTSGNISQKVITGLAPSTTYTYRVRATDALGLIDPNTHDVSATTLANRVPALASVAAVNVFSGQLVPALDFNDSFTSTDQDRDGDVISYSCRYDETADGVVASNAASCSSLSNEGGGNPSFQQFSGAFSGWRPRHADVDKVFEIQVDAIDVYAGTSSVTYTVSVQAGAPLLATPGDVVYDSGSHSHTGFGSVTFPDNAMLVGDTWTFDLDNERVSPADDNGITYACTFQTYGASGLGSSANCTTLPGTAAFNTTTGAFSWSPNASAVGSYRLTVTATNPGGVDTKTVDATVRRAYQREDVSIELDSNFATRYAPGTNSPITTAFADLAHASRSATLSGFSGGSVWVGSGSTTAPHALNFDGIDDRVDLSADLSSATAVTVETWIKPVDSSAKASTIWTFGDGTGHGWTLRNGAITQGNGTSHYAAQVLADSPTIYMRFGETSGTTIADITGNTAGGTLGTPASVTLARTSGITEQVDTSLRTAGNGVVNIPAISLAGSWTVEAWFAYPFPNGCGTTYCTLTRGSAADHQVLVRQSDMQLGVYRTATTAFIGSGFIMSTLSNGWHHLAAVGSGANTTFYVDGVEVGSAPFVSQSNITYVGNANSGQPFGDIDEVAIYNTALSPDRIAAHYAAANKRAGCNFGMIKEQWTHVSMRADATDLRLYLNGIETCQVSLSSYPAWNGSLQNFRVGRPLVASTTTTPWAGEMSAIRVFIDDSVGQVSTLYAGLKDRHIPNIAIPTVGLTMLAQAGQGTYGDLAGTTPTSADNDPIGFWRDLSPKGDNYAAAASDRRPLLLKGAVNGQDALRFDGVNDALLASFNYSTTNTVMYVSRMRGTYKFRCLASRGNYILGWYNGNMNQYFADGWILQPALAVVSNTWFLYTGIHNGAAQTLYRNGVLVGSGTAGTNGPQGLVLGGHQGTSQLSDCDVAAVIAYDRALTNAERLVVEQYLRERYGL